DVLQPRDRELERVVLPGGLRLRPGAHDAAIPDRDVGALRGEVVRRSERAMKLPGVAESLVERTVGMQPRDGKETVVCGRRRSQRLADRVNAVLHDGESLH